jgi:lipopolysaccharide export system protein LptA
MGQVTPNIIRYGLALLFACTVAHAFAEKRKVEIKYADFWRSLKRGDETINRLIGNVLLMHNGATMTCDSAYIYPDNHFEAFSRVMVSKDTTWLFGDYMDYQSSADVGKVRGRLVTLLDGKTRLRTQFLDFNTATNTAVFTKGGTIDNGQNLLESDKGCYYSSQKLAIFNSKVEMKNEEYRIKSDSLHYLTEQDIATFFQQTYIWHEDVFMSFRQGYYSKPNDHFFMSNHVYMMSKEQESWSDSAHYYRSQKEGEMFGNVQLYDSAQRAISLGDYAKLYEDRDLAYMTKEPAGILFSDDPKDDTLFIKADTLLVRRIANTDSATVMLDSTRKYMHAFFCVKFYHPDIQGVCDSMAYSAIDSLAEMFYSPILWNQENQMSADKMEVYQKNNQLHRLDMIDAGFIISLDDSVRSYYNQIKGKLIVAHFAQNDLYKVDVFGAGQTIYYLRDSLKLKGVHHANSADIFFYLKNRKVQKMDYVSGSYGKALPPKDIDVKDLTLKGFSWQPDVRPRSRYDITRRAVRPSGRQQALTIEQPEYVVTKRISKIKNAFFPPENIETSKF